MTLSALILGVMGLALSFFPQEIIAYLAVDSNVINVFFLQIMSALYLGFALLNWMSKDSRIGGIYNRPIAIANFMHFGVGTIALAKALPDLNIHLELAIAIIMVYTVFAILFAFVFLTNPFKSKNENE